MKYRKFLAGQKRYENIRNAFRLCVKLRKDTNTMFDVSVQAGGDEIRIWSIIDDLFAKEIERLRRLLHDFEI